MTLLAQRAPGANPRRERTVIVRSRGFGGFWRALPFLAPALALYVLFLIVPVVRAVQLSFTEWSGFDEPQWVGLENYIRLFTTDQVFGMALRNTIVWTLLSIIVPIAVALPLAIVLNARLPGRVFFRSAFYVPSVLATIVVAMTWNLIYRPDIGFLNQVLEGVGLGDLTRGWLGDPEAALYAVFIANVWAGVGGAMILFLAGLQSVPQELVEACRIDGGNRRHVLFAVELPAIRPMIGIVVLLSIIGALKAFDLIVAMTGGGPGGRSEILALYSYNQALTQHHYGTGAAVAVVLLLLSMIVIVPYVRWQQREAEE